jgi:hypothetical protein
MFRRKFAECWLHFSISTFSLLYEYLCITKKILVFKDISVQTLFLFHTITNNVNNIQQLTIRHEILVPVLSIGYLFMIYWEAGN